MTDKKDDELRDTGRAPKFTDEREHMSNARIFDTLVTSNIALVRSFKAMIMIFAVIALLMTISSAAIVRMGQNETRELTRELLLAIGKRNCVDMPARKD